MFISTKKNRGCKSSFFFKALELNPKDAAAWSILGLVYQRQGKEREAEEAYLKAIESDPLFRDWDYIALADLYKKQKREEDATAILVKATGHYPQNAFVWSNLGNAYDRQGRDEEAFSCFFKATEVEPKYEYAWHLLGCSYSKQNKNKEALRAFLKALELKRDLEQSTWRELAKVYEKLGLLEKQQEAQEKYLELEEKKFNSKQ